MTLYDLLTGYKSVCVYTFNHITKNSVQGLSSNLCFYHRSKKKLSIWQTITTWPYFPNRMVTSAPWTLSPKVTMKCMVTAPLLRDQKRYFPLLSLSAFLFTAQPAQPQAPSVQLQGAPLKALLGEETFTPC